MKPSDSFPRPNFGTGCSRYSARDRTGGVCCLGLGNESRRNCSQGASQLGLPAEPRGAGGDCERPLSEMMTRAKPTTTSALLSLRVADRLGRRQFKEDAPIEQICICRCYFHAWRGAAQAATILRQYGNPSCRAKRRRKICRVAAVAALNGRQRPRPPRRSRDCGLRRSI